MNNEHVTGAKVTASLAVVWACLYRGGSLLHLNPKLAQVDQ